MKRLLLVRHAKSSWNNTNLSDFDRPLNNRGKRDAPFMGQRLTVLTAAPDQILSSTAKRAITTARLLAGEMGIPEEEIITKDYLYLADHQTVLDLIRGSDNNLNSVMIVGHNPGITDLANYLHAGLVENIPTCRAFCLDFGTSWKEIKKDGGNLQFFDYPKKHL